MGPTYVLKFSLEMFRPGHREIIRDYLDGYVTAQGAATLLCWSREEFERHLATIFSLALNEAYPEAELRRA